MNPQFLRSHVFRQILVIVSARTWVTPLLMFTPERLFSVYRCKGRIPDYRALDNFVPGVELIRTLFGYILYADGVWCDIQILMFLHGQVKIQPNCTCCSMVINQFTDTGTDQAEDSPMRWMSLAAPRCWGICAFFGEYLKQLGTISILAATVWEFAT